MHLPGQFRVRAMIAYLFIEMKKPVAAGNVWREAVPVSVRLLACLTLTSGREKSQGRPQRAVQVGKKL